MEKLSWLRRPFDPRLQYSFLYTFCGGVTVMLISGIIQLPLPDIDIPPAWDVPGRLLLGAAFAGVMVLLAYRGRNRKHSHARGWGWYDLGMVLGCLTAAHMGAKSGGDSGQVFLPLAGLLALLLAASLYLEWRERNFAEE